MKIGACLDTHIKALVDIDRRSYGDYGESSDYFINKLTSSNARILVVEEDDEITVFVFRLPWIIHI